MSLRKLRIFTAGAVFILFLLAFLGDGELSERLSDTLLWFQFTPSLLAFVRSPVHMAGMGFVFLILASFIFGRCYCSFFCPLGILQDIVNRIMGRAQKKYRAQKPYPLIRYGLLALTLISAILGSFALVNLLDPYSLFGRPAAHGFKALVLWTNNLAVDLFEYFDIYLLRVRKLHHVPLSILAVALGSLGMVLTFAFISGRAYCNTICPVGALLGLVSRFSLFGFAMDSQRCKACGSCEAVCKAGCIDSEKFIVDPSRCVSCFNCLDSCRKGALTYKPRLPAMQPGPWVPSKRVFLASTTAAGGTLLTMMSPFRLPAIQAAQRRRTPIMPPGSKSFDHFTQRCSGCHLCVSVCPTNVLTPAYLEYGVTGILQPRLDYLQGHCDFDCIACGQVCPTGAIGPLLLEQKRQTRIGTVKLNKERCIVHVKKKHCGACGEACPTHAIFPVEKGQVLFPEIEIDYCIGCGACEKACPTRPKAITVSSEPVHAMARKYVPPAPVDKPTDAQDKGFPF